MRKTAVATIGVIGLVLGYAFIDDLFSGLPFTRASSSWLGWAVGLFVGGVAGLLIEAASEWVFGSYEHSRSRPPRIVRIAIALFVGLGIAAIAFVLNAYFSEYFR